MSITRADVGTFLRKHQKAILTISVVVFTSFILWNFYSLGERVAQTETDLELVQARANKAEENFGSCRAELGGTKETVTELTEKVTGLTNDLQTEVEKREEIEQKARQYLQRAKRAEAANSMCQAARDLIGTTLSGERK